MNVCRWGVVALMALALLLDATAVAQTQARAARVAYVATHDERSSSGGLAAFRAGMRELGQIEGRSYVLDVRYAQGRLEQIPELIANAIDAGAEVIVTNSYPGAAAATQATNRIPIAGSSCGLDVLVASLARPGGNLTGVTCQSSELAAKQLQLLREAIPALERVAVLYNPASPYVQPVLRDLRRAGSALRTQVIEIAVGAPAAFENAVEQVFRARVEAVLLAPDAMLFSNRARLVSLLSERGLPVMGFFRQFVDAGALLSYSANLTERHHRLAWYVDRILKGTKPADLPIDQPTKFELVINLKTAKALGITIPQSLRLQAAEVIE